MGPRVLCIARRRKADSHCPARRHRFFGPALRARMALTRATKRRQKDEALYGTQPKDVGRSPKGRCSACEALRWPPGEHGAGCRARARTEGGEEEAPADDHPQR